MSETEFDTKAQFIEAVRDEGAVIDGVEYFTQGEGNATTYHARTNDGEVEDVTKSDVEDAWEEIHDEADEQDEEEEDEGPEEVHLGTFYFASSWDEDEDRKQLEAMLEEAGWYIDGEVDSGGYRIKTER